MISLCREESYKFKVFSLYIGKSLIGHSLLVLVTYIEKMVMFMNNY